MAYLIAGHHAGLPDWYSGEQSGPLEDRLQRQELLKHALGGGAPTDLLMRKEPISHLRALMEVGLVDESWLERVPVPLRPRLQELLDNPEG